MRAVPRRHHATEHGGSVPRASTRLRAHAATLRDPQREDHAVAVTKANRCLYLFSSDRSPLYTQDILNVLAAPPEQHYTFRYAARYLADRLADQWLQLQDYRVLVLFSLQQRAEYIAPAFVPIRTGHVV